ncbi:MAG: type IV toxin-antitoxin system AbiEi family antitoxin domain-containing protein [Oligoflexia bacterium]|nr:type IV toxin-antitoxin system AbiEi family antitoxin domain-containing protein [Oligoflexia bacterium]
MNKKQPPLIQFMKAHNGYARTMDLRSLGLQSRQIRALVEDKTLLKVRHGYYKFAGAPMYEHSQLVDICTAKSQAVIALASALEFFGLTTYSPSEITIALPHNYTYGTFKKSDLPVKVYYFPKSYYEAGLETLKIKAGTIKIFSKEKTICDMFRYRKTFGEDIALEGLKNYLGAKKANIQLLQKYAQICGVSTIINPYIKAMVAR